MHYLIVNVHRATWGKGASMAEAIEKCPFTGSQDDVFVYIVDREAKIGEIGNLQARQFVHVGAGKVRSDLKRVALDIEGHPGKFVAIEQRIAEEIHQRLDGSEWSSETCDEIADVLRHAGYTVRAPEDMDEE